MGLGGMSVWLSMGNSSRYNIASLSRAMDVHVLARHVHCINHFGIGIGANCVGCRHLLGYNPLCVCWIGVCGFIGALLCCVGLCEGLLCVGGCM